MDNTAAHNWSPGSFIKNNFRSIRENSRLIARFLLVLLFVVLIAWFYKHEQHEIRQIKSVLLAANLQWVLAGVAGLVLYIVLQGVMYKLAFASVRTSVTFPSAILLYLKRNLISIFMPAGGVTSLAFFMGDIEKQNIPRTKIYFASSLYAFIGMLTAGLMALPIFIYGIVEGITGDGEIMALAFLVILIILLFLMYRSVVRKKLLYRIVIRIVPSAEVYIDEIISHTINVRYLIYTIGTSVTIDLVCIGLVYLSMVALGIKASLPFAMMSYVTGIIAINVSPFMKGLGAVEISMSFVLTHLGYTNVEAVTITLLYRFFEFWLPMIVGALSFLLKINKLLMRIIPALLIFGLGIINIISAITPAIAARLHRLEEFIPFDAIAASNYLVLIAGALMLLTAVFMLRGLRSAWWIALILSAASCIGHLTKAIDYEEATVALIIFIILIFSRKEYNIRGNPRLHTIGIWSAVLTIIAVLIYGTIGFYYLDAKQFGINFNMWQSIVYTIRYFVFIGNPGLVPHSHFTRYFLVSISISGFISLAFLFYTILRPYFYREQTSPEEFDKAKQLVTSHGNSALDYFKTYFDKLIFIPENTNGFISYRTAGSFAVALENPVAENPVSMQECITKFDRFCFDNGYITAYYRVPEESLPLYWDLSKKSLFIGQEAIVDLNNFTLSGVRNKALRNAINKVVESGFRSTVNTPPLKDGLMQKIKAVSDEWLRSMQRDEIVFSQGMFIWNEIKNQTVITVENYEERVIAFLNIIPDYAPGEATYDLIRKTDECPHGVLDFLLAELFKYLKSLNYSTVNLGFAPMSGLDDPHTFTEKTMRFAYERIRSFSQFRGLRFFKEKFFPVWKNKYLIYSNDYDLLQIPAALSKVIKPGNE